MLTQIPQVGGYLVVDPRYLDDSQRELERLDQNDRFVGVKIHAAHSSTNTSSREMKKLFALIAPYRKPVLIHNLGSDWPEALVELAMEYPDLPIIAAHSGYGDAPHPTHDAAIRLAPAPNIYLEFCSTYLAVGAIQRGLNAVGPERLLFGSDFPLISLPYMLACYEEVGLRVRSRSMCSGKTQLGFSRRFRAGLQLNDDQTLKSASTSQAGKRGGQVVSEGRGHDRETIAAGNLVALREMLPASTATLEAIGR